MNGERSDMVILFSANDQISCGLYYKKLVICSWDLYSPTASELLNMVFLFSVIKVEPCDSSLTYGCTVYLGLCMCL